MRWFKHWISFWGMIILLFVSYDASLFAKTIDFGRYHALLIANQNYKHWNILKTPLNDVDELATILRNRYGFYDVKIIPDATRDQIINKLEEYRRNLSASDNLLIYYAGHGKLRKEGGYWIGVDAQKNSRSRWLHFNTISELIDSDNGMKARHVLVIADSCYAGALLREEDEDKSAKKQPGETDQAWFSQVQKKASRTALTSGGTEPVIDRAGIAKYSIFAQELIRRLKSNTNVLETESLWDLIKKDVHARAKRIVGNDAQAPEYDPIPGTGHDGGDFLFVLKDSIVDVPLTAKVDGTSFGIKGDATVEQFKTNNIGMKFVYIARGTFTMGSPANEPKRYSSETQHQVTLTQGFYMQTTEVTQGQWQAVMGSNPSNFKECGNDCPVENVSWNDVQDFIKKLNAKESIDKYRLPTEAEWEYAARAGTKTPFAVGDCLSTDQANYNGNYPYTGCPKGRYRDTTVKVGSFDPNAWGLYDMHGNVWEWCRDWYGEEYFAHSPLNDPEGPINGSYRVIRGGCWYFSAGGCRAAFRSRGGPGGRYGDLGFRLVLLPGQQG